MASRKPKTNEAEIVPDEVIVEAKPVNKGPARKVVETKTVTYEQPIDEAKEIKTEDDFDFDDMPKKPKKKTEKELRNALRERLGKSGVLPTSQLRIHVFKFENENDPTSGVQAEKSFCCKFFCNEDGITNGQHLDIAQKYGPGRYFFMVYMNNAIVTSFEERVSAPSFGQVIQNGQPVAVPDPQNPGHVIVQMPAQQQVQADPFADFDKTLKMFERMEKMRASLGLTSQPAHVENPQSQLTPEQSLAATLLLDPEVKKKAVRSLLGSSGGDDDVSWATVARDLLTSEHGPQVVREFVGGLFNGFRGMFAQNGGNNGQAQMAQASHVHQNAPMERVGQNEPIHHAQEGQEALQGIQQISGVGLESTDGRQAQQAIRPEDELLARILEHCKNRSLPKTAADQAMKYADLVEQQAPHLSIYTILEYFADSPIEDSLTFLETRSDEAKEILAMPHAKAWATQLQAELKKAYEPGGVE